MNNIIYGQYDSTNYPLKRYLYNEIPEDIKLLMEYLNNDLAIFRGGLAYVFLLNKKEYLLKDLDMLAETKNKEIIIKKMSLADILYVNKNSFGKTVLTAFWNRDGYYKLDVLLCDKITNTSLCEYENKSKKTVSISYLWRNRIEKIAEKEERKHEDKKTLNHYKVSFELSKYLEKNLNLINHNDIVIVKSKINKLELVLKSLINENDLEDYLEIQKKLIGEKI